MTAPTGGYAVGSQNQVTCRRAVKMARYPLLVMASPHVKLRR